jgi:hypothetical protein
VSFKDIVQEDRKRVFLNLDEFGDTHTIDGKEMTVIVDNNEMLEREKRYKVHDDGIFIRQVLIYVLEEDFGPLPAIGRLLKLDNKPFRITDAINEDGIYSISLEANKS